MEELSSAEVKKGPLIASVGPSLQHFYSSENWEELRLQALYVNYYSSEADREKHGLLSAGPNTYVISPVNEMPKYSDTYRNCTGIAVMGFDPKTKTTVSLLSHQDPQYFLHAGKEEFGRVLTKVLKDFKERVEPASISVHVFGGHYLDVEGTAEGRTRQDDYRDSIDVVSGMVRESLNVEPHVSIGPNAKSGEQVAAMLDTQNHRLFVEYPEQDDRRYNTSFPASNLPEAEDTWQNAA